MKNYVDKDKLQEFAQKLHTKQKTVFALKGETATDEQVANAASAWLEENVDPVGSAVVVDQSLSIHGAAADAKIVDVVKADAFSVRRLASNADGLFSIISGQLRDPSEATQEYPAGTNTAIRAGARTYVITFGATESVLLKLSSSAYKFSRIWTYSGASMTTAVRQVLASETNERALAITKEANETRFAVSFVDASDITRTLTSEDFTAIGEAFSVWLPTPSAETRMRYVKTTDELENTTEDFVLVTHNRSAWTSAGGTTRLGTGGPCLFEKSNARHFSKERTDGTYMMPVASQGVLAPSGFGNVKNKVLEIIDTYVGNDAVIYGGADEDENYHTMFHEEVENKEVCSSFLLAVLYGIPYETSRHVLGSSALNVSKYNYSDTWLGDATWGGFVWRATHQMARWFAERGQLHYIPDNAAETLKTLQAGDVLFISRPNEASYLTRYFYITHVAIVLEVDSANSKILIAHCTNAEAGSDDLQTTACRKSWRTITDSLCGTTYQVFARPNWKY